MRTTESVLIRFGASLILLGLISCHAKPPSRDFFVNSVDTVWFNDSNYWWLDTTPINFVQKEPERFSMLLHGTHLFFEGQAYWKDSTLFLGSDPRSEFEGLIDFRSPYCVVEDENHRRVYVAKVDSLPETADADPVAHFAFWSFSLSEGLLGVSFFDTLEHRFTYHLGKELSCQCDTSLCNLHKGNFQAQAGSPPFHSAPR